MVPNPDASQDYLIRGPCSARDLNVLRRRCPTPGMRRLEILDHFLRTPYVPVDRRQLQKCRRYVSYIIKKIILIFVWTHSRAIACKWYMISALTIYQKRYANVLMRRKLKIFFFLFASFALCVFAIIEIPRIPIGENLIYYFVDWQSFNIGNFYLIQLRESLRFLHWLS